MPSFLSRLQRPFHRRRDESGSSASKPALPGGHSDTNLLSVKESILPSSASATFAATPKSSSVASPKFSVNRTNSKKSANGTSRIALAPQIALKLPEATAIDQSSVPLFEGIGQTLLDKNELRKKRLNAEDTLSLLQIGSEVVVERGLETLGIFRPHWHSETPLIQQSLLSLFLSSLSSAHSAGKPTPSKLEAFRSELRYTSDPHDVTSVLKWGLRHLQYEHDRFVPAQSEDGWLWYREFLEAERQADYPLTAFSSLLLPRLPPGHATLLSILLDLISSVAAHVDSNAMSGSKLSKALALWVLRPSLPASIDFVAFYDTWRSASRIMEHFFLSYVRDSEQRHKLPTRLVELVAHYPFSQNASAPDDYFLPRPELTTYQSKGLLVRVKKQRSTLQTKEPLLHPLDLLGQALVADYEQMVDYPIALKDAWDSLRASVRRNQTPDEGGDTPLELSQIVTEESLRILSLDDSDGVEPLSPISLPRIIPKRVSSTGRKRRSFSLDQTRSKPLPNSLAVVYEDAGPHRVRSERDLMKADKVDWDSFSSSGFGYINSSIDNGLASSLSGKNVSSIANGNGAPSTLTEKRKSLRNGPTESSPHYVKGLALVTIDESFVDLWSDCILDPDVREAWPEFVLCQLPDNVRAASSLGVEWLVIERDIIEPPPPPVKVQALQRSPSSVSAATTTRFTRSLSRATMELAGRKRFSLFSATGGRGSASSVRGRKESSATAVSKQPISELGEVSGENANQSDVNP